MNFVTAFTQTFANCVRAAVPVHLFASVPDGAEARTVLWNQWLVRVYLFSCTDAAQAPALADRVAAHLHQPRNGLPILVDEMEVLHGSFGKEFRVQIAAFEESFAGLILDVWTDVQMEAGAREKDQEMNARTSQALKAYEPILRELAQVSGRSVRFIWNTADVIPPARDDGVLRIRPNCAPHGAPASRYVYYLFGTDLDKDGKGLLSRSPAPGRGRILKDGEGIPFAQIVGSDFFLLFPTLTRYYGRDSQEIFRRALAALWQDYQTHGPGVDAAPDESPEAYTALTRGWASDLPTHLADKIRSQEEAVADLLRRLASAQRAMTELRQFSASIQQVGATQEIQNRLSLDFERIRALPGVAKFGVQADGLLLETHWIHAVHDGRTYRLGRYAVWFGVYGVETTVWAMETAHPAGKSHPHIGSSGNPCFGNATEGIAKLLALYHFGDAVELILRWLSDGYVLETSDAKMEEWPVVPEVVS